MGKKEKHKFSSKNNKRKKGRGRSSSAKNNTKKISLAERLRRVYEDVVSLETTCNGLTSCCKVAMPQMNYCEFTQLAKEVWNKESNDGKIKLLCTSVEYFFRNEFEKWNMDALVKPCMLLSEEGRCKYYEDRPLSCRMYGLWPDAEYNTRVDRFEKALEGKLKREEIPLNTQCKFVRRVDDSVELTTEVIEGLFSQLDDIDKRIGGFSAMQVKERVNYRTFHDWLLLKVFGEQWLTQLSAFTLAADQDSMKDQIDQLNKVITEQFSKDMPEL